MAVAGCCGAGLEAPGRSGIPNSEIQLYIDPTPTRTAGGVGMDRRTSDRDKRATPPTKPSCVLVAAAAVICDCPGPTLYTLRLVSIAKLIEKLKVYCSVW